MNKPVVVSRSGCPSAGVGFTLVEMALVLGLIGLLAYLFLPLSNTLREDQQRREARAKLEVIDAALVRFVMLNNRLPCPADGRLPRTDTNYGHERLGLVNGCVDNVVPQHGVVPWRTLGLPDEAAIDPWGNLITYRPYINNNNTALTIAIGTCGSVLASFQAKNQADWNTYLTNCLSPPLGGRPVGFAVHSATDAAACASAEAVANPTAPTPRTGAAYVLISHGANRCGAYTPDGSYVTTCSGTAGLGLAEQNNRNNNGLLTGNPTASGQCYKDGLYREKTSAQPFDDVVLWRTVMQVAVEAKKVSSP